MRNIKFTLTLSGLFLLSSIAAFGFDVMVFRLASYFQRRRRHADAGIVGAAAGFLAIAAVAVAHEKRLGGTFVAHPTAKAASGKCSHRVCSLSVGQLVGSLLALIAREIDNHWSLGELCFSSRAR